MDHNVLLDRSSGSFESFPRRDVVAYGAGCRPGPGARPRGAYGYMPTCPQYYHHFHNGGAWSSAPAPALPRARPQIYSSPSLPLLPSNQPPLLPLPPKYGSAFPYPPPPTPPRSVLVRPAAMTNAVLAPAAASRQGQGDRRRRRPARPGAEQARAQKKTRPLERAAPLPPAPAVAEALDDLEREVARTFVQDLLHALAPPPSSLPLPTFSLVAKAASPPPRGKLVGPPAAAAAPSCNAEAANADGLRRLLRL